MQSLSIVTACVPYIKSVLLGIESGMFQTGHLNLTTLRKDPIRYPKSRPSTKGPRKVVDTDNSTVAALQLARRVSQDDGSIAAAQGDPFPAQSITTVEPVSPEEEWDENSQSSQTNIIKHTRGWQVEIANV